MTARDALAFIAGAMTAVLVATAGLWARYRAEARV